MRLLQANRKYCDMKMNQLACRFLVLLLFLALQESGRGQNTTGAGKLPVATTTNSNNLPDFASLKPYGTVEEFDETIAKAEKGDAKAQFDLGVIYAKGTGVKKDVAKSFQWFHKAAEQGVVSAQTEIAWMYQNGVGVPQDYVGAYKWDNLAAASGDEWAITHRDYVASLMTPEQIAQGQEMSRNFKPDEESDYGTTKNAAKPKTFSYEEAKGEQSVSDNSTNTLGFIPDNSSINQTNSVSSDNPTASGTGFFITDDGYLITCAHVVEGATKISLLTSVGTVEAKLVQTDSANDIALLKADGKFSALPIAASRTASLGDTVATVGFPDPSLQGFSPKLAKGEIAALAGAGDDVRYFQISVPVQPGNSGGALVDGLGNVVGIVSAKLDAATALAASGALPENVNYAVKSSYLLGFLESVPGAKLNAPNTNDEKFTVVVKFAQLATVLVLVTAQETQVVMSAPPQTHPLPANSTYSDVNGSHTIDSVMDDGNLIKLDDDSLWQVSPLGTIDSQLWLSVDKITVIAGQRRESTPTNL